MDNEKVWYEVNEIVGKYIFVFGMLISILSLYFTINPTDPGFIMIYILLAILIFGSFFKVGCVPFKGVHQPEVVQHAGAQITTDTAHLLNC